jgi:hypothetical protein
VAANSEAQQILEQLAQARHDALMWSTPNIQPTQSPILLTGGLSGDGSHPGGVNIAAIQAQQALEMQQATMQQIYLKSYSQGTPGVMSPVQTMMNPIAANYQLQNMYMMNPYMANFIGGGGGGGVGGGGMNLAPSYMMTAPSMGVFRNGPNARQSSAIGFGGWARDLATLSTDGVFGRSFAPYEDPIDERIDARRRITRRKENAAAGTIQAGAALASFMIGGPMGLAVGLGLEPLVDTATSAYYQRRAETEQIYDISKRIATGGNATGFRSKGFSLQESNQLMKSFRAEAASSPFYNMQDYMQVLDQGTQAGLYNFAGNSQNTEKKTKELISMIDVFMRIAGDPDVKSAMQRMGSLQTMGLSTGQMNGALTNLRASANLAGTSVDQIMSTSGAYGAQMATSMGGPASFGMLVGAHAQAIAESTAQRGIYTENELSLRGGKEGLTQSLTQAMTNNIYSDVATNVAAFTKRDSTGKFVADTEAFEKYTTSGQVQGGGLLIQKTLENLGKMKENMPDFLAVQKDIAGQLVGGMSNFQQLMAVKNSMEQYRKINPEFITEDMAAQHVFGDNWKAGKSSVSAEGISYELTQLQEAQRSAAAGARSKYIRSHSFFNRIGVGAAQIWNNTVNAITPLDWMANYDQETTMREEGKIFLPGLNYGLAASAKTGALGKLGYGQKNAGMSLSAPAEIDPNQAYNKLEYDTKFRDYMLKTSDVSPLGSDVDGSMKAATLKRFSSLKSLNTIDKATAATGNVDFNTLENYAKKDFRGSGGSTVFDIDAFLTNTGPDGKPLSASAQKQLILEYQKNPDYGEAIQKHRDAMQQYLATPAETRAENQDTLLRSARSMGLSDKQIGNISNFSNSLAEKLGGRLGRRELETLESQMLGAGNVLEKGETGGTTFAEIASRFPKANLTGPDLSELYGKYAQVYSDTGDKSKTEFGKFITSSSGREAISDVNAQAVEGATALEEINKLERTAPPSAFSNPADVNSYAVVQAQALMRENFDRLASKEGGSTVEGESFDQYYGPKGKGSTFAKNAKTEGSELTSAFQNTTTQNLDMNPQLSEKQNLRRMANALDGIEAFLKRAERAGAIKNLRELG